MITNKHKEKIVSSLYGLIEGNPSSVIEGLQKRWHTLYGFTDPYDNLVIEFGNKIIAQPPAKEGDKPGPRTIWGGWMKLTLVMGDEEFSVTRDWYEEHKVNRLHPDFHTDLDFYEKQLDEGSRIWSEWIEKLKD